MEWFWIGVLSGFSVAGLIAQWSFRATIKSKAESGIDMCLGGRFYTIRRNLEREGD